MSGYAVDHSFMKAFKPIDHKIYTDLDLNVKSVSAWMHRNHLKMNNGKAEFIKFGTDTTLRSKTYQKSE